MRLSLLLITVLLSASLILLIGCGGAEQQESSEMQEMQHEEHAEEHAMEGAENVHHDIVCGMDVEVIEATPSVDYEGETYYFCSEYCKEQFEENPGKYAEEMEKMHGEESGETM